MAYFKLLRQFGHAAKAFRPASYAKRMATTALVPLDYRAGVPFLCPHQCALIAAPRHPLNPIVSD